MVAKMTLHSIEAYKDSLHYENHRAKNLRITPLLRVEIACMWAYKDIEEAPNSKIPRIKHSTIKHRPTFTGDKHLSRCPIKSTGGKTIAITGLR
jgi:hypothetical protein